MTLRSLLTRCILSASLLLSLPHAVLAQSSPVIYLSFHGGKKGVNTIYSYDASGNTISQDVTQGDPNANGLRSGIIRDDGTLLMCNANKHSSRLVVYSTCQSDGSRYYLSDFATTDLAHPYGLTQGINPATGEVSIWATNQDTFDLVQFNYNGTFQEQVRQFGNDELRSVVFDDDSSVLYVADEAQNAVLAYDTKTQDWVDTLNFSNITDPIGLFIDANSQTIFIGSNGSPSAVYAYNISTGALLQTYQDPTLQHPAGMITLNGALWVISQTVGSVLQFDVASGVLLGTPISSTPDTPEQIFLSPC